MKRGSGRIALARIVGAHSAAQAASSQMSCAEVVMPDLSRRAGALIRAYQDGRYAARMAVPQKQGGNVKRLVVALAVAVVAFPAGALALPYDPSTRDHQVPSSSLGVPPELMLPRHIPATGTDVAAPDQQSPVDTSVPAPAPSGNDFDWGDAGIGAGSAIALLAVSLGSAFSLRRRRIRLAG